MASTIDDLLNEGVLAAQNGRIEEARQLLSSAVQQNPMSETGWYWLGIILTSVEAKAECFQKVLALNPHNREARMQLDSLSWGDYQRPASSSPSIPPPAPEAPPPRHAEPFGPPQPQQPVAGEPDRKSGASLGDRLAQAGTPPNQPVSPFVGGWENEMESVPAPPPRRPAAPEPARARSPLERRLRRTVPPEIPASPPPESLSALLDEKPARKKAPLALWGMLVLLLLVLAALLVTWLRKEDWLPGIFAPVPTPTAALAPAGWAPGAAVVDLAAIERILL